jgi:filamentous hemagglutinin family protein
MACWLIVTATTETDPSMRVQDGRQGGSTMRFIDKMCVLTVGCLLVSLSICNGFSLAQAPPVRTAINENGLGTRVSEPVLEGLGKRFDISGGTERGSNLFHSFSEFNLGANDIANFVKPSADTGPSSSANTVISRVTSAQSLIDGMLQANGWSNFYFINPHGIVFGPTAKLQAAPGLPFGGSAVFTTANYLKFWNGEGYDYFGTAGISTVLKPNEFVSEVLSFRSVSSFGFVGNAPNSISITGSKLEAANLSVIGGPISIDGAMLKANGKLQVASVGEVENTNYIQVPYDIFRTSGSSSVFVRSSSEGLGYGGEVTVEDVSKTTNLKMGKIVMNPDAVLDSRPNGMIIMNPGPETINPPPGAQKIILPRDGIPNLVKIVTAPFLDSATPTLTIDEGATQLIRISLNKPAEIGETVVLVNTDPSTATTEPIRSVPFSEGQQTQDVKVTGLKEGTTEIRATLRNVTKSTTVNVRSLVDFLKFEGPGLLDVGDRGTYTITLTQAGKKGTFIDIPADEAGVVKLVSTGSIDMENRTTAEVVVEAVKKGETDIRAQLRNSTKAATANIRFDERLNIQTFTAPDFLDEGAQGSIFIKLNRIDESLVIIDLIRTGSRDAVSLQTEVVRIDPGADTSDPIRITGEVAGDVTITARLRNAEGGPSETVRVQSIPVEALSPDLAIKEDQVSTLVVTLARETQRQIRVDLTNSDPTVAAVDPFVLIEPGTKQGTASVVGLKDGTAVVTAKGRAGEDTAIVRVSLLDPPPLSRVGPDLNINVKSDPAGNSIVVNIPEPFKRDIPIRLSSSDPNIATVGEVAVIKAGQTESNSVPVAGNRVGKVIITAVSGNSSAQAEVNVDIPTISREAVNLASSAQYPRIITAPPATINVPRLLAGRCAGNTDGQFSSFAQLNRESAPSQPGRYLSAPVILEGEQAVGAMQTAPEISFQLGPPKVLTVKPDAMVFTAMTENCRLEIR